MKKSQVFTNTLTALTLLTAVAAPTASAVQTDKLVTTAHSSVSASLEENLNQVVTTINTNMQKQLNDVMANNQSLVVELAASQSKPAIKDDKTNTRIAE